MLLLLRFLSFYLPPVRGYGRFAHALLLSTGTDMELQGRLLSSVVSTSIGDLNITGVPLQAAIQLKGANQFLGAISVDTVELLSGSPKGLVIAFNLTVHNPLPNVAMEAGGLIMSMRYVRRTPPPRHQSRALTQSLCVIL
jgi:hypothetical protein